MKISKHTSLSDAVTGNFRYAEVFEKYGLDYCCNGKRSIEDACSIKDLDPSVILNELENSVIFLPNEFFLNVDKWEVEHIIELITDHFHKLTIRKIDVINFLLEKVCAVHGHNHPELFDIKNNFDILYHNLISHMKKEEDVVFPYILKLKEPDNSEFPPYGSIENPLSVLLSEHESAGRIVEDIRKLSNGYSPPEDACIKYETLFNELEDFETELHRHVHIENNILFDKARDLEKKSKLFINK